MYESKVKEWKGKQDEETMGKRYRMEGRNASGVGKSRKRNSLDPLSKSMNPSAGKFFHLGSPRG